MHRVLYVQYTNPAGYPPLEHSSRILAESGWKVLFLGTGALGAADLRFPPHPNIRVKKMNFCPAGWRQKIHYARFLFWVFAWALLWRPQRAYASDMLACPAALLLNRLLGLRVMYHEHDSPSDDRVKGFHRFVLWTRRKLAARADCCILPNQQRVDRFKKELGVANVFCVWNCPALEEVAKDRAPFADATLWVLYHGSITPARLPMTVLNAMAMLPGNVKLRVIGYQTIGHGGYVKQFLEEAQRLGIQERLDIVGSLPTRGELLEWGARAHVGLALMPSQTADFNEQTMAGASNKVFDYMSCGVPVLVSDRDDWRSLFVQSGYGLACKPEDPQSIAVALSWYLKHPEERRTMGERGRRRVATEWNYQTQFSPVLDCVKA